jgi:hypothetical protein
MVMGVLVFYKDEAEARKPDKTGYETEQEGEEDAPGIIAGAETVQKTIHALKCSRPQVVP